MSAKRIVCLTTETTEVLYLLGEQDRIVGISGYITRPAIARREKPKVSAFTSAKINKILDLQPDLVLTCTDLQADIAASLIKAGIEVHAFNQRSVVQILNMISTLGALTGSSDKADRLVAELENKIASVRETASYLPAKPRIYFEEWDEPMISGIRWVSELIEAAGGADIFPEMREIPRAPDRVVTSEEIIGRSPDIIIASWCGKKADLDAICKRPGWDTIPAVRNSRVHEIKSAHIL